MTISMIIAIIATVAIFAFLLLLDGFLNRHEEFQEVRDWHNFRNAFDTSKKGDK
jgi:hypothetical protein